MRNLKCPNTSTQTLQRLFYINYEEFKDIQYTYDYIDFCMFYINYEEFKDGNLRLL